MLDDLKLLFKYGIFLRMQNNSRKGGRGRSLLATLFIILAVSFPVGMSFYALLDNMMGVMVEGVSFAKIYVEFAVSLFGLFFIISFGSMMSYQFIKNEETEFLSPLPIRRQAVVVYQFLTSLVTQSFMLVMMFIPLLIYAFKLGMVRGFFGIVSVLISLVFFSLAGGILAMLFSLLLKRSVLKRLMFLLQISSGVLWILMFQFMPNKSGSMNEMARSLVNMKSFFDSPFNLLSWSVKGVSEPLYMLFSLMLCLAVAVLFFALSRKAAFYQTVGKASGKKREFSVRSVSSALIRKELVIYKRNEQLLYFAFYPFVFGLIMGIINKSPLSMIMFMTVMGTPFMAQQSAFLLSQDAPFMILMKSLPIDAKRIISLKSSIPVIIGMLCAFIGILVLIIINGLSPIYFLILVPVFILNKAAVNEGLIFVIKTPPQGLNNPASFMKAPGFVKTTLFLMALALVTCMPLLFITDGGGNLQTTQWWWPLISAAAVVFCLFRIRSTEFKIKKRLENWV